MEKKEKEIDLEMLLKYLQKRFHLPDESYHSRLFNVAM